MSILSQSMHFFSFGYYHHDITLCSRKGIMPDNTSILNYAMRLNDITTLNDFITRLEKENITYKKGRLLQSAKTPDGLQAVSFKDPNGYYWIEVLGW